MSKFVVAKTLQPIFTILFGYLSFQITALTPYQQALPWYTPGLVFMALWAMEVSSCWWRIKIQLRYVGWLETFHGRISDLRLFEFSCMCINLMKLIFCIKVSLVYYRFLICRVQWTTCLHSHFKVCGISLQYRFNQKQSYIMGKSHKCKISL